MNLEPADGREARMARGNAGLPRDHLGLHATHPRGGQRARKRLDQVVLLDDPGERLAAGIEGAEVQFLAAFVGTTRMREHAHVVDRGDAGLFEHRPRTDGLEQLA